MLKAVPYPWNSNERESERTNPKNTAITDYSECLPWTCQCSLVAVALWVHWDVARQTLAKANLPDRLSRCRNCPTQKYHPTGVLLDQSTPVHSLESLRHFHGPTVPWSNSMRYDKIRWDFPSWISWGHLLPRALWKRQSWEHQGANAPAPKESIC